MSHRNGFTQVPICGAPPATAPRSARMPHFVGLSVDPDQVLQNYGVMVIGTGSVGANVALGLARLQIGRLWLLDPGLFKRESLITQPVGPEDVGRRKAECIGEKCKRVSPNTRVHVCTERVQDVSLAELLEPNLVLLAADNLNAETSVAQWTSSLEIPLIQASVHGETLVAQIRAYGHATAEAPCLMCAYGETEFTHLSRETTFSCEGIAEGKDMASVAELPTMSAAFLCSTSANLALTTVLRHVLGLGQAVWDRQYQYCGFNHECVTSPLVRNPDCRNSHVRLTHVSLARPLPRASLREVMACLGKSVESSVGFLFDNMEFVERAECTCGRRVRVGRFVTAGAPASRCSCGRDALPMPYYSHRPVGLDRIRKLLDVHIGDIVDRSPESLTVLAENRNWLVTNGHGHMERTVK